MSIGDLTQERLTSRLKTQSYGHVLHVYDEVTSTNDVAKHHARLGAPNGAVFFADTQTRGRGSRGRTWVSPGGDNLYISIIDRCDIVSDVLPTLTFDVGVAVAKTVEGFVASTHHVQIKHPNDVLINQKKVAGILLESAIQQGQPATVIIGIGVNVNHTSWSGELASTATSLCMHTLTGTLDRADVLAELLTHVEHAVIAFKKRR